jgi:type IV pilus assembly protein PilV
MALMEVLVSLTVLCLGLLGLVAAQTRLVADSVTSSQRAIAIGLIEDLNNRLLINREAALTGSYDLAWGAALNAVNCNDTPCTASNRARADLREWVLALQRSLPGGAATVFRSPSDPRQLGIVVSWVAREGGTTAQERAQRLALLSAGFAANSAGVACPAGNYCQLLYVQP